MDLSNLDVKNVKDQLVSKSMEAFWLDNSEELLTDAIHKSAVVVSETGEESSQSASGSGKYIRHYIVDSSVRFRLGSRIGYYSEK